MSGIVEFLRARLDEDEAAARAAFIGPWRYSPTKQWHGLSGDPLHPSTEGEEYVAAGDRGAPVCIATTGPADNPQSMRDADHIARHDPARVLREVEAKRRIVDRYEDAVVRLTDPQESSVSAREQVREYEDWVLPALALSYADHLDYDETWAV